ncbi:SemiSWEET family sugar transporter [Nanoarchaeota archaeon]
MVQHSHGMLHHHVKKRHEPYPHPEPVKRVVDKLVYLFAFLGPIMTLPQVWKIWSLKTAAGVSLLSWSWYLIAGGFWLAYGIMHKDKPIIITNVLYIILEIFIVIGIVVY